MCPLFFFFNDTATTEIYTLSLHDALPIFLVRAQKRLLNHLFRILPVPRHAISQPENIDRKSTRLNSSHGYISYAVFCLKKKTTKFNYDSICVHTYSTDIVLHTNYTHNYTL